MEDNNQKEIALLKKIVHNMAADKNPYEGMPCNYRSYGDYCEPDTCWCNKSGEWLKKNDPETYWGKEYYEKNIKDK